MKKIKRRPLKPRYSVHFLRQWREKQGMTRQELAAATDLRVQTIGRIENRLIQLTQTSIDAFARALRVSRGAFFRPPPNKHGSNYSGM
jgi:transcriptional regulator with XRE-family HTH domain